MQVLEGIQEQHDCRLKFAKIVTCSDLMLSVFDQASRAAAVDTTALIRGESGTGKELIAEAIHNNSPRREGPYVIVNMAAVPENLIESELLGHVPGAFTGASAKRLFVPSPRGQRRGIDQLRAVMIACPSASRFRPRACSAQASA